MQSKGELESDSGSDHEGDYQNNELVQCRFYRDELPRVNDLVYVVTTDIRELGAYVRLLEYDNIEGFIMMSQVTSKRVKSVARFLRINKLEFMEVMRVDAEKRCIDLSKKSLKEDQKEAAMQRYKKAKIVHAIMRQTAVKLKTPVLELYEKFGWDLYDQFEHAYDAFRIALSDTKTAFAKVDIKPEQLEVLMDTIRRKMSTNPLKIRCD